MATWVTLPFDGEPLESAVYFGNGKDADLELRFVGGRRVTLPTHTVRVEVDDGVVVEVSSWDDISLRIEYSGPGLSFRGGQFGFSDDNAYTAEFPEYAQSWLAAGCEDALSWVVEVRMRLASRLPGTSAA